MDIDKEILDINNNIKSAVDIVNDIRKQQEQLDKKLHLFKVVSFVNLIEKMKSEDVFQDYEITYVRFNFRPLDNVDKPGYVLNFIFLDVDKKEQSGFYFPSELSNPYKMFDDFFEKMGVWNLDDINHSFADGSLLTVQLNSNCREEIYRVFLSEEIKKVYDYSNMNLELAINDVGRSKKPKI